MSQTPPDKLSVAEARKILWKRGNLKFKLHKEQEKIYEWIKTHSQKIITISSARRFGKSTLLCTLAIEQCITKENSIVKFVAPEVKQIKMILRPLMRDLLKDCPAEMRPTYKVHDHLYRFPNGSEIQLAASDAGNIEAIRGGSSDLCLIDEAGSCTELLYAVRSILLPTTTTTKGKIIVASTPPISSDHDFRKLVEQCESRDAHVHKTVFDNPLLTQNDIQEIVDTLGGAQTIEFRREYLAEMITDEKNAIVPEFGANKQDIIRDWDRPPFYDAYTSMDLGFKDLTVVLFGYLDFRQGKLIIEDELILNGQTMTTDTLAERIKEKESKLWVQPLTAEIFKPYLRVSDNNLIVINDLYRLHNLLFLPTAKDNADAAINDMRILLAKHKIIINPRCKTLARHLEAGTWNKARTSFNRSGDDGHYDAIDALVYLVRNILWNKNPYPANFDITDPNNTFLRKNQPSKYQDFKELFKVKKNTAFNN